MTPSEGQLKYRIRKNFKYYEYNRQPPVNLSH